MRPHPPHEATKGPGLSSIPVSNEFTQTFDAQLGDLASSLGDATRRGIYIATREAPQAVTASQIAEIFRIHPNVARHHLDRLVEDGYLQVIERRRPGQGGPGAGRPAKCYATTTKEVAVQYPPRRYDLLSELLVRVLERISPERAAEVAVEVGRDYGRQLAAEIGLPEEAGFTAAVHAVAKAMMGVGFGISFDDANRQLVTSFCPFGDTAANHPAVACKLDQGLVSGLMEAAHQTGTPVVIPHRRPEEDCVTEVSGD